MIDLSSIKNIHVVGIGGVSNSAIAEILLTQGFSVSGSDLHPSDITEALAHKGVTIYTSHLESNVDGSELVVYTSAVSEDNPELLAAHRLNIPCISRAEMLGQIMAGYKESIAISGTHGKTTTTSMVTRIFNDATYDPTALVGGHFNDIKSNVKLGKSELFITEACEYKENFLSFYPRVGVILNIDEDHLDYFRDLEHIVSAFAKFSNNIHEKGTLVLNGDDYNSRKIIPYYKGKLITFGLSEHCDYTAKNVVYNNLGYPSFDVFHKDAKLCKISLVVPGQHNIYNALAAFIVGIIYKVNIDQIQSRLSSFKNANRRFEFIGKHNDIIIVDDYAHHPSEIKATIDAALRMTDIQNLYVIFQPHTYSRTKELINEFSSAFKGATEVILCDIYAAREVDHGEISSKDLMRAMQVEDMSTTYLSSFPEIVSYITKKATPGDLIITMGAGDVTKLSRMILSAYTENL